MQLKGVPHRSERKRREVKLAGFFEFAFEGVFGAVAGFGEIAIGAVLHGIGIAVAELIGHGVVAGLTAFVGFFGTFAAVGVVLEVIAGAIRHGNLSMQ